MTDTPQEPDPKDSPPAKPPRLSLGEHGRIVHAERVATILVVEDDTEVREAVRRYLTSKGHHVVEAANGIEALTQLKVQTVDLVLTDIDMPEMHGIELIQRVRQEMPEMPIVVITAVHEAINVVEHELGIEHVLKKPFKFEELEAVLRQVLT